MRPWPARLVAGAAARVGRDGDGRVRASGEAERGVDGEGGTGAEGTGTERVAGSGAVSTPPLRVCGGGERDGGSKEP